MTEQRGRAPSRDEWRRLEPLLDALLDAPPSRREALLAELCGGDAARRAELERLVAECERTFPLLDATAADRFGAVLAADGRDLYFKSHDAHGRASFWSVPAAGGRPRLLVRFDDPAWSSNRFDFASDGARFYFTVEDRQSDLWVAEIARR